MSWILHCTEVAGTDVAGTDVAGIWFYWCRRYSVVLVSSVVDHTGVAVIRTVVVLGFCLGSLLFKRAITENGYNRSVFSRKGLHLEHFTLEQVFLNQVENSPH